MGWCNTNYEHEVGYDIDFRVIIRYQMHEREFGEMTIMSFPCLVQLVYDEVDLPEILGVDVRVKVTGVAQTSMIKDLSKPIPAKRSHNPLIVILAQLEGPSISTRPTTTQGVDIGLRMDFEMRKHRETPKIGTQGDGTPLYPLQFQLPL